MMAVGWICGIADCLFVQNHRRKYGFGHQIVPDLCPALELPDIAAMTLLGDVHIEPVAGKHRTPKPGIVDTHEIDQLAFRFGAQRMDYQDRGGLRHRLDDQHSRHHGPRREMALKIDLRDLLLGASRIDHNLSFFLARRCSTAVCLINSVSGTAGLPHTVSPAGMSRMIPLLAAIRAPLPICKWPASPPCPPTITKSSSLVLPEIPT